MCLYLLEQKIMEWHSLPDGSRITQNIHVIKDLLNLTLTTKTGVV